MRLSPRSWSGGARLFPRKLPNPNAVRLDDRLSAPNVQRPADYDRNPAPVQFAIDQQPGQNTRAMTTEFSYRVPTGRKAWLEQAQARVVNDSATGTNGPAFSTVRLTPNGRPQQVILDAMLATGAASREASPPFTGPILLNPLDTLVGDTQSQNNAAGSNIRHNLFVKLTEFDA